MTPAALLLTVLFVADDPALPVIAVDVAEAGSGRHLSAFVINDGTEFGVELGASSSPEGSRRLRDWPLLPPGASLTPAVDGVILTLDDVGLWQPAPPAEPPKKAPTKKKTLSTTPELPVAGDRALRLFLPTILDGSLTPQAASLHGSRVHAAGVAIVVDRAVPVLALSLSGSEADGGAALVTSDVPGDCAAIPATAVQRLTTLTSTKVTCAGALVVSRAAGKRLGDKPANDKDARGLIVRRTVSDTVKANPAAATAPTTPAAKR